MKAEKEHIDELIVSYLSNELDGNAVHELKEWIAASVENEKYFMQRQEIWFSAISDMKNSIYNKDEAFQLFRKRVDTYQKNKMMRKRLRWKIVYKYVAFISIIGFISYFSYWRGKSNLKNVLTETGIEVETPIGSQTRLRLPDGTIVILNAGSRIIYPQNFGVYNRDVELQGEGYFEVARNIEMPFYVKTKELQVRVLGTKFNFRDYPEDKEVVVSLLEGRIVLNNQLQREEELLLLPNEQVILDKRVKTMKKEWKRDGINIEWITGRLFFDEIPLPEVAQILERNYGVRIKFANDALKKIRFYGNFNKNGQSVRDILEALSATEKVHYTLNSYQFNGLI